MDYIFYIIDFVISCFIFISVFKSKLTKREQILRIILSVLMTVYSVIGIFFDNIYTEFSGLEFFIKLLIYITFFIVLLPIINKKK